MPVKSKKQERLMRAAMHNAQVRKQTGISKKTAAEMLYGKKKGGK